MKPAAILIATLSLSPALAQDRPSSPVHHCQARCVAFDAWHDAYDVGTVDGVTRGGRRRASTLMENQCRSRVRSLGWGSAYDLRGLSCWTEREEDIDVTYSGRLPVGG